MGYGKRGQILEQMIEHSNTAYKNKGLALVDKVPTPWNVHYNKRTGKVISAFPQKKGTVDFIGVSHGRALAFEAKTTNSRTNFPLDNFQDHQVKYLHKHEEQGGIAFSIVFFEKHNELYFLTTEDLEAWWEAQKQGGRKSIPYSWFRLNCMQIKSKNGVMLHYLEHCNTAYKKQAK